MSVGLPDWLCHRASALPRAVAVITADGVEVTYAELNSCVLRMAEALRRARVEAGDRVALLSQNSLDLVEAIHAVPRLGATLVPLNTRLTPPELAWQLADAGPRVLLCDEVNARAAREAAALASLPGPLMLPLPSAPPLEAPADFHSPEDLHSIIYTSGTTGLPKGTMLTFGNFWASAAASAFNLGVSPGDRWLACMPLFHVGGLSIVLRNAIGGTAFIVHPRFDEHAVVRALHEQAVTHVSLVSSMLQRVLDADHRPSPSTLRVVLVGGGPVPVPLLELALDRGFPVIHTYGLTEAASQVATLSPADALTRVGSAGKPLVTTQLKIDAPPGEPGNILISGPTVTPGYFRNEAATTAAIRDGWLHTGDIGRLDPDGFLYVLDRREDLILSGGENVYPAEVESVLMGFAGVREAAVVGMPDERWGQVVAAALVTDATLDRSELDAFLRERLAGYKRPRVLRFVDSLPKTASGKIQRRLVRESLCASQGD